jgi:hypothetical protein
MNFNSIVAIYSSIVMMWDLSVVHEWFNPFLVLCDMNLKKKKKLKKLLWF